MSCKVKVEIPQLKNHNNIFANKKMENQSSKSLNLKESAIDLNEELFS